MKKLFVKCISISLLSLFIVTSCRNKDEMDDPAISDSENSVAATHTSDNDNLSSNLDDAMDKINTNLSSNESGARIEENCGFTVDLSKYSTVSGSNQKVIIYIFNSQSNCDDRLRQGTITATLVRGNFFREKDAEYTLDFAGYAVTYKGKTLTLSGQQTVTNVTGGLPRSVIVNPQIYPVVTHKVTGQMSLAFDTTKGIRSWETNREITWTNNGGILSYTIKGNASADGYDNLMTWGTNRFGNKFYNQITTPLSANSECGWYKPVSGEHLHTLININDGSNLFTVNSKVNVGLNGCGNSYTVTTTKRNGKTRTTTINY